jgi:hypothetical protein
MIIAVPARRHDAGWPGGMPMIGSLIWAAAHLRIVHGKGKIFIDH